MRYAAVTKAGAQSRIRLQYRSMPPVPFYDAVICCVVSIAFLRHFDRRKKRSR